MPYKDPEDARRQKRRYYADPDRAEQRRQYLQQYRLQRKALAAEQAYRADPEVKEYRRKAANERRRSDPQYRQAMKERNAARRALAQAGYAPRSKRRWTPAEDTAVLSDAPLLSVALQLGRSYDAVAGRRRYLRKQNTNPKENRNV